MKLSLSLLSSACVCALSISAQAVTLVSWDFTGNNPLDHAQNDTAVGVVIAAQSTYATTLSGVTSTDLVGAGDLKFSNGVNGTDGNVDEINVQSITSAGWLMDFTLDAGTGTLDITGISIELWRNGGGAPDTMAWQLSTDGGSNFTAFGSTSAAPSTGLASQATHTFTDSVSASNVVLRFAPTASTGNLHITSIEVEGIPEPSALLLGALSGLALLRRRRG